MQSKISLKLSLSIIGGRIIIFSLIVILFIQNNNAQQNLIAIIPPVAYTVHVVPPQEFSSSTLPVRLLIPKIKVDAAVEYLGLTSSGAMDVPKGPSDVAWFDLGPRPGEIGDAVIAGHYGWKDNIPASFDNLSKLKIGDEIYVEDYSGATTTFIVKEIGNFDKNADSANVFDSSDGKAHLNLVTCEGIWNAAEKSYSDRLVVFTDEEI
jgi:LPXTG-site transpeptidase (sortase) family protein